jgi:MFS family permease
MSWLSELTSLERRTLGICFGGWTLDQFDAQIFSFLVPTIIGLWGISPAQAGLLGTVTLLISALGGWIAGAFADRYGRVVVLQVTIVWFALFTFLCGFTQNFQQLFICRALQGLGFGGEWGVGAVLMGEVIRDHYRGRAVGLLQSGASVGWGLAGIAYLALFAFVPEFLAWRILFWMGVLPALLVFWVRRYIPEPKRHRPLAAGNTVEHMFAVLRRPYLSMTVRVSLMVVGAQGGFYALNFWLPTYLRTVRNISSVGAGSYVLVTIAGAFCGFLSGAFLGDAIGRKPTFLLSAAASLGMTIVYLFGPLNNFWILPAGFVLGVVSLMMFAPMGAFMTELYPTAVRATGQGFCYNAGRGVGSLFPALVGLLTTQLGLGKAIGAFTIAAYALMLGTLLLLPETKGRDLAAFDAGDDVRASPAPAETL